MLVLFNSVDSTRKFSPSEESEIHLRGTEDNFFFFNLKESVRERARARGGAEEKEKQTPR